MAGWLGPATELLKANGYTTCVVGRLDMMTADDWRDPAQVAGAADRVLGSASGGPGNYFKEAQGTPWFKDGKRWVRPDGEYSTDLISNFAADFIEESANSDKPFFIYVSHYAPHWPLPANEEDIAPYRELYQKQDRKVQMQARLKRQIDAGLIPEGAGLQILLQSVKSGTRFRRFCPGVKDTPAIGPLALSNSKGSRNDSSQLPSFDPKLASIGPGVGHSPYFGGGYGDGETRH